MTIRGFLRSLSEAFAAEADEEEAALDALEERMFGHKGNTDLDIGSIMADRLESVLDSVDEFLAQRDSLAKARWTRKEWVADFLMVQSCYTKVIWNLDDRLGPEDMKNGRGYCATLIGLADEDLRHLGGSGP